MTRKDYILIAEHANQLIEALETDLSYMRGKYGDGPETDRVESERDGAKQALQTIAYALRQDNPRFDGNKFLKACGI
jgi:hypothetical protein